MVLMIVFSGSRRTCWIAPTARHGCSRERERADLEACDFYSLEFATTVRFRVLNSRQRGNQISLASIINPHS